MYTEKSENSVAKELDVSRNTVQAALNHLRIDRRGQSEAERKMWSEMVMLNTAHVYNR